VLQGMVDVVGSGGANIGVQAEVSSSDGELTTVPVPDIFQSIPAICEMILENNLKCKHHPSLQSDPFKLWLVR